ncbi:MAG: hypothetical protein DBX59_04385 [Bacillota bacterium]|nr:MAG: hypothetical protein DBX59_04385 [Bacillota bacterium]
MKTFRYVAETAFLLLGTIIGSGFISGREIVTFFGKDILPLSLFASALFFLTTWQLLAVGGRYGTLEKGNAALFSKAEKGVNAAVFFCMFAVVSASLAMCDSMFNSLLGIDKRVPAASLVTLALAFVTARRGIDGVKKLNVFLVPVMLTLTLAFLFGRGKFHFGAPSYPSSSNPAGVVFYVGFNMFLSAAVIARAGSGDKKSVLLASAVTAVVTVVLILLVYGAVNYEGVNAAGADLPLFYVFSSSPAMSLAFGAVLYAGALTTVACSYYPLAESVEKKFGKRWGLTLAAGAFLFSRLGVKLIVAYVYPAAGVLGALYFAALFLAEAYKKLKKGNINMRKKNKEKRHGKKEKKKRSEAFRRGLQ